ncbi:MAG: phosphoribosylglycinamide formyltransferase [Lactimicrobium massiliense]|nr:phosphoribosylglycinamide formyltransferase [Lactimicrobium massiliense]MDD6229678.1 phosphoribosylglycinamide formyltransferase [Lactimicrobium massiliense]MDD6674646.1 phosphoribosylglycinamide formyltransferase [Lactimicrobium massiliense]MDD6726104.1 phosphoribosylglycinamide formyltransferase [Lactimicrobium massiliense]
MTKIAVLVSGGGTNLQALLNAEKDGKIPYGQIVLVVSSRPDAYALERAEKFSKKTAVICRKDYASAEDYDQALLSLLKDNGIEEVILAGFLSILGQRVIAAYPKRIINIHPSLIPSFCGKGYYGLHVHEAALKRGVKVTGATVHYVNEIPDGGQIIAQKAVEILPGDTPEVLQKRVMEQAEWILLPKAAADLAERIEKEKKS